MAITAFSLSHVERRLSFACRMYVTWLGLEDRGMTGAFESL